MRRISPFRFYFTLGHDARCVPITRDEMPRRDTMILYSAQVIAIFCSPLMRLALPPSVRIQTSVAMPRRHARNAHATAFDSARARRHTDDAGTPPSTMLPADADIQACVRRAQCHEYHMAGPAAHLESSVSHARFHEAMAIRGDGCTAPRRHA